MALSKKEKLLILGAVLVIIDQASKILVKTNMCIGDHFSVIGNWFQICFIENEGMAFGMKFGGAVGKYILSFFRICLFAALAWWISDLDKKQKAPTGVLVGLTLIAAGALGNIFDCLFYGLVFTPHVPFMQGRVVDMLYFPLIDTYVAGKHITFFDPVFNFADSCVTVGAFYLLLFQWRFFTTDPDGKEKKKK